MATRHHMRERDRARTERSERQSRALLAFANRHSVGWGGVQSALREICEQSCGVIRADRASVWMLVNEEVLRCVEQFDCSNHRHESGMQVHAASVPEYLAALRDERVIDAEDARTDPRTRELVSALSMSAAISLIAAPVRRSGKLAGFVTFECTGATRKWQGDEVTFAAGVADQVAQAYSDCEREEALTDLRQTAAELMRLQDEERRRIGRDLHDSTGQTLAALELSLSRLMQTSGSSSERRELLEQCAQLASQCSAEIRTASYLLHPPLLDELGLLSALRWLADGFHERSGIQVRLDLPSSMDRLSRDEELTLFRVAQEALTNVHRHADSALAALRLFHRGDSVILEVEDAGVGTRGGVGSFVLGVGLAGMRERLRQVGGSLTVESSGKGTIVRAALPTRRETTREVVNA
jgi:signal transduction histidine kinase